MRGCSGLFQSTPPRGRRHLEAIGRRGNGRFQSTPPRGRRRWYGAPCGPCCRVSIHASAREATFRRVRPEPDRCVSIHASAREATPALYLGRADGGFQSTPPRGRRRVDWAGVAGVLHSFNPRLRAGGDDITNTPVPQRQVSIHASAREATPPGRLALYRHTVFQSTPPRGRRQIRLPGQWNSGMFQSTPPRGRRLCRWPCSCPGKKVSIHASAREATCISAISRMVLSGFNPRLRAGGDPQIRWFRHRDMVSIHASAREATL